MAATVVRRGQAFCVAEALLLDLSGWGILGTLGTGACVPKASMKWPTGGSLPPPGPLQPLSAKVTGQQALSHAGLLQDSLQLAPFGGTLTGSWET